MHRDWLHKLPQTPGNALDVGAGSGRNAIWLAKKGWQVTAVEPCEAFQQLASQHPNVTWLNDSIPKLEQLDSLNTGPYQCILVSAIWMHLSPSEQAQSLKRLKSLLAKNGGLVITWRNQANDTERQFHSVYAAQFKGATITSSADEGGRDGVMWQCAVITADESQR